MLYNLPVNGDGTGQGEGDGVTRSAGAAHPVGGGCGAVTVHVAAVSQHAVRRVEHRVLIHGGGHSGDAAAYCANMKLLYLSIHVRQVR